jgi:hypothetical protein
MTTRHAQFERDLQKLSIYVLNFENEPILTEDCPKQ